MSGTEKDVNNFIQDFREEFMKLPPEDIAFPRSVNGIGNWSDSSSIFKKGTPMHIKGVILYNHFVRQQKLTNKYPLIQEGEKIKFLNMRTPNRMQSNVISFMTKLPKELDIHSHLDYDTQFERDIFIEGFPSHFYYEPDWVEHRPFLWNANDFGGFFHMRYTPYTLQDVVNASNQNKFNVISTFAGGGGSSTGYRLAGGKILCINEFVEEEFQNTYRENYPDTPILMSDIKELSGKDFLDIANIGVGELDILDGSPPCSAFSVAGKLSHSRDGKHSDGCIQTKNYSDGKMVENIEDLFFEFLRVADDIKPKVIIAENVKGLTIGEIKEYFNKIQNTFEDIGYDVVAKVLDSRYFGISQTRTRVFFIGVRNDITEKIWTKLYDYR